MAHMMCKCGNRLSTVSAPNDIQWRVYSDREWDEIINLGQIDSFDLPFPKYDVWRCPKCERIFVFSPNSDKAIKAYVLEDN